MARTTPTQVDGAAAALNQMLARRGSTARVSVERRNGGTALDLCTALPDGTLPTTTDRTLTAGTAGEVWFYLHAMREALWLLGEPGGASDGAAAITGNAV